MGWPGSSPPRSEGRSSQATLSPGTMCSGTRHLGLALPAGTDGRSCAVPPWCSQEPTAAPCGARHPRNAQTQRDLPRNSPLPTSPSRLPAHLSNLWDKVPTPTPWTPDPQVLWSPASPSLSYHPTASPHAESSLHCICLRRRFQPGTSTQILQGVKYLHVSSCLQLT